MRPTSKYEIEKRRTKVLDLKLAGVTVNNIASSLDIHRATVLRDLKAIYNERLNEAKERDRVVARVFTGLLRMEEEMWKMYKIADKDFVKLGAFNKLMGIYDKMLYLTGAKGTSLQIQQFQGQTVKVDTDLEKLIEETRMMTSEAIAKKIT